MAAALHGLLIIDKPAGWTSHDVVARVRRLTGQRKTGHAGTLDPAATGVLPVALGMATRGIEYLSEASKTYLAEVTFGIETDSLDIDGTVTGVAPVPQMTTGDLDRLLEGFRGPQQQLPPMHAAIKVGGRKLYELARAGISIEVPARAITIHELTLVNWEPPVATLLVDCSKGTYIRSLARDLGAAAGCGAYLSNLIRTRTGPFHLCEAWTLEQLADAPIHEEWERIALHPDATIHHLPAIMLDGARTIDWGHGKIIAGDPPVQLDAAARVYGPGGDWLGIATWDADKAGWQPNKVIPEAA